MCLANSSLSAPKAASTRSAITLSACSCASLLGGPDAHATRPHNTAAVMPAYGTRLITRNTLLASTFLAMRCIPHPRAAQPAGPPKRPGPAIHARLRGPSSLDGQNLKFSPVEKPCGRQPPQVVGPALL